MSKRSAPSKPKHDAPRKRYKPSGPIRQDLGLEPVEVERGFSAKQLQQLLTLDTQAPIRFLAGIQTLESFLASISSQDEEKCVILKEYCELQRPKHEDGHAFASIIQAWNFAIDSDNVDLITSIIGGLVAFLRSLNTLIDFQAFGVLLGRTILKQPHLTWLSRSAAAPLYRERLLCRSLELLCELVSFDDGVLAREVFLLKSYTFDTKYLSRNLCLWKHTNNYSHFDRNIRSYAIDYVLANCKYQPSGIKVEMLKSSNVFRCLFESLKYDTRLVISKIFEVFRKNVLLDPDIPSSTKAYTFGDRNLTHIASLFRSGNGVDGATSEASPADMALEFLEFACLHRKAGLVRPSSGWYPPGTDSVDQELPSTNEDNLTNLGLQSIDWYEKFWNEVIVRNGKLSIFSQSLRPYVNMYDSKLLLKFFTEVPELVADYFLKKAGFTFEPKLTTIWIGYASFIYSTLRLPIPENFNGTSAPGPVPPPVSIMIENVLPLPLNQKTLTRCLHQNCALLTIFALRLLVVGFERLERCLLLLRDISKNPKSLWHEAAERLTNEFSNRVPDPKEVFNTFRQTPVDDPLQRETCLRVLKLYHEIIPVKVLDCRFDFSNVLRDAMSSQPTNLAPETDEKSQPMNDQLKTLQVNHLLQIVRHSPDTRWFHPPSPKHLSPFTTLLRIIANSQQGSPPREMLDLMISIGRESSLFNGKASHSPCLALIASLKSDTANDFGAIYSWIDVLTSRGTHRQIKYLDDYDEHLKDSIYQGSDSEPISLIWMVIEEQWPFVLERKSELIAYSTWISNYLFLSFLQGEDKTTLDHLLQKLVKITTDDPSERILRDTFKRSSKGTEALSRLIEFFTPSPTNQTSSPPSPSRPSSSPPPPAIFLDSTALLPSPSISPTASQLHRPTSDPIDTTLSSLTLIPLITSLSNPSCPSEISTQAYRNLLVFRQKLLSPACDHPEKAQLALLIGSLCNTASSYLNANTNPTQTESQVPTLITAFATAALPILLDPSHTLYSTINKYLLVSPRWEPRKTLPYFMHSCIYSAPDELILSGKPTSTSTSSFPHDHNSIANHKETSRPTHTSTLFLLRLIASSLATPYDLQITLKARNLLSPVLALSSLRPDLPTVIHAAVLKILWRMAGLGEDACAFLIIKAGIVAWFSAEFARLKLTRAKAVEGKRRDSGAGTVEEEVQDSLVVGEEGLKALVRRVWEGRDKEQVKRWGGEHLDGQVQWILGD